MTLQFFFLPQGLFLFATRFFSHWKKKHLCQEKHSCVKEKKSCGKENKSCSKKKNTFSRKISWHQKTFMAIPRLWEREALFCL